MTNRFCDLCGWETPSLVLTTRIRKKRINIGYMCGVCGKIHTYHFPLLFLLREDALAIKRGEKKLIEFQPRSGLRQKSEALLAMPKLDYNWADLSSPE